MPGAGHGASHPRGRHLRHDDPHFAEPQSVTGFIPSHRGGAGEPLVLVHGFMETWRSWELVLPALERRHDVLALTLPGHAGGPPVDGRISHELLPDAVERAMDEAGFADAHIAGNSLGGYVALQLAARGRARSVVALAPAGGWAEDDKSVRELLELQRDLRQQVRAWAADADAIAASPEGRRRATELLTTNYEHIPADLVAHLIVGIARCEAAPALVDYGLRNDWTLDGERIACPVRIIWGTDDRLLPWPSAAAHYYRDWLPNAD